MVFTSFVTAATAGGVALFYQRRDLGPKLMIGLLATLFVSAVGNQIEWTEPAGPELTVAAVQGNVSLEQKWQPNYRQQTLQKLLTTK